MSIDLPLGLALLVVMVGVPFVWAVTVFLTVLAHGLPADYMLRASAAAMFAMAVIVTAFAAIFVNNTLDMPVLTLRDTQLITRTTLLVVPILVGIYLVRQARRH